MACAANLRPQLLPLLAHTSNAPQYDVMETVLFKEVGPGGFDSVDFELVQQLGSIRLQPVRWQWEGGQH